MHGSPPKQRLTCGLEVPSPLSQGRPLLLGNCRHHLWGILPEACSRHNRSHLWHKLHPPHPWQLISVISGNLNYSTLYLQTQQMQRVVLSCSSNQWRQFSHTCIWISHFDGIHIRNFHGLHSLVEKIFNVFAPYIWRKVPNIYSAFTSRIPHSWSRTLKLWSIIFGA